MKSDEQVFCLRRSDLDALFGGVLPQGAFAGPEPAQVLALPQHFLARGLAEDDPSYKQLIPYQLFSCRDRYFVYRRGGGVGEGRLAGRLSVGIGGHINLEDAVDGVMSPAAYLAALLRERQEELVGTEGLATGFLGWINDDASPVGRVHLGAVHLGRLARPEDCATLTIRTGGEDIQPVGWWSAAAISSQAERFEQWALLAVTLAAARSGGPGPESLESFSPPTG